MPEKLPVATLAEAIPHLRRPFTAEAISFRPVGGGSIVGYVDARTVIERLNAVIPTWSTRFEPFPGGKQIVCHLTIDGVTRSDVGTQGGGNMIDPVKVGYSDALKRSAVHFGVAVSVYALKRVHASDLPANGLRGDGKSKTLTAEGEKWLRNGYRRWLEGPGKENFGEALDHGDEEGAVGSLLDEGEDVAASPVEAPSEEVVAHLKAITDLYDALPAAAKRKLGKQKFNAKVRGAGTDLDKLNALHDEISEMGE